MDELLVDELLVDELLVDELLMDELLDDEGPIKGYLAESLVDLFLDKQF